LGILTRNIARNRVSEVVKPDRANSGTIQNRKSKIQNPVGGRETGFLRKIGAKREIYQETRFLRLLLRSRQLWQNPQSKIENLKSRESETANSKIDSIAHNMDRTCALKPNPSLQPFDHAENRVSALAARKSTMDI